MFKIFSKHSMQYVYIEEQTFSKVLRRIFHEAHLVSLILCETRAL